MENENLYNLYENKLKEDKNPGLTLAKFYSELFTIPLTREVIITMNRLNKLYGREKVFHSIIDIYNMENLDHKNIYGILNYHCKRHTQEEKSTRVLIQLPKWNMTTVKVFNDPFAEEEI